MTRFWALVVAGLLTASSAASAQVPESTVTMPQRAGHIGPRRVGPGARGQDRALGGRQMALAGKVRQAFRGVVRRELNLSDDQAKQLDAVDARFQSQRDEISRDERAARVDLARMLRDSTQAPDAAKVNQDLDRLVQAQQRRAGLLASEQKALSAFLDPVQRAKYLALREQLARRVQQMRQDGRGARGGRGRPPQP